MNIAVCWKDVNAEKAVGFNCAGSNIATPMSKASENSHTFESLPHIALGGFDACEWLVMVVIPLKISAAFSHQKIIEAFKRTVISHGANDGPTLACLLD